MAVDCMFYVRELVSEEPTYRYRLVSHHSPRGDGRLRTDHPPIVGDFVFLYDKQAQVSGGFTVIARSWSRSSYGSINWPVGKDAPVVPDLLDIVCEAAVGPFVSEADEPEGDDAESP